MGKTKGLLDPEYFTFHQIRTVAEGSGSPILNGKRQRNAEVTDFGTETQ